MTSEEALEKLNLLANTHRSMIQIHLVHWDQCWDWEPGSKNDLYTLCGLHAQRPLERIVSWVSPADWVKDVEPFYYRCLECESHPDYPILLLGAM
jgi:hypothetical protein